MTKIRKYDWKKGVMMGYVGNYKSWFLKHIVPIGLGTAVAAALTRHWISPYVVTNEWLLLQNDISQQMILTLLHMVILVAIFLSFALLVRREVKKRQQIEEVLRKSARETELFAYSVVHDLKNPAIAVHGLTKRLVRHHQVQLNDRGRECLRMVLQSSSKVVVLIDQIQVYIKTRELPLKFETVDSRELVKMMREEFYRQLSDGLIKWRESKEMPKIKADRVAVSRVLRNLIDNALKYGGENLTEIKVLYQPADQFHIFIVADDGVGISQESAEIIFDPFRRSDSCGKEGSGLGLAIVREIAKQHGGNAWAETSPMKGTRFFFSIAKDL